MTMQFVAVQDTNRKPVRGLWRRGDRYYLQMRLPGEKAPRKVPLEATSLSEAKAAMEAQRSTLRGGEIPSRGRKPGFSACAEAYLAVLEGAERPPKSARTIREERLVLERWKAHLRHIPIDQITAVHVSAYRDARLVEGLAPRTINLHLTALRNVLAKAVEDGWLKAVPTFRRFKNSEARPPTRPRLTDEEFKILGEAARACGRNGQLLYDFVKFLGYSGARKTEALGMLWKDVNFASSLVTFRNPKGGVARSMEMIPSLIAHLEDMSSRRDPDSSYLFPSPERGERDEHACNLTASFNLALERCGLDQFASREALSDPRLKDRQKLGLHDLRRYFATKALELGADPQTVSRWMGHKDGGALLLRTYSSVRAEHRAAIAAKLNF